MKKNLLILIIFLLNFSILFCETPIVNVPDLPRNLRNFVTDESKYFELLLDYYVRAKLLACQLDSLNIVPNISYTYIQNQDLQEIRRYYNLAKELYKKVIDQPDEPRIISLQNQLQKATEELYRAKIELDSLKFIVKDVEACKRISDLKDSVINSLSNKLFECEKNSLNEFLKQLSRSKFSPLLGGNIKAQQFFFDNPRLTTSLSPSFDLELHLFRFANDVLGLKFSASYTYLSNTVEFPDMTFPLKETYKDDIWNFSTLFYVDLSKMINSQSVYWEIDLSAGYFRGFTKSYSPVNFQNDYKGYSLGAYTLLGGFSQRVPIGVLAGVSFFKFIDNFGYEGLMLGKPFVPSAFIGIKFNILNTF